MKLKRDLKSNSFFSPAKINLFFRILKKRDDGFHEIESLVQAISFGDHLHFELSTCDELVSSRDCGRNNLVTQGLHLFRKKTGVSFPVKIYLEKRIPMEGGLGGGSSNLATTLWALNQFLEKPYPESELRQWAGELSSDASFFFSSGTAYATGRGEKIESLAPMKNRSLWLAHPGFGLSTPLVFKHCTLDVSEDNDLEAPAFKLKPELKTLKQDLLNLGFEHVLMTGSGTTFYCFGETDNPVLPGITFYPVSFLARSEKTWYCSEA